jgi:hypothetical protein
MASIERTAYPRFKPSLTANELQTLYCPTDDERALIATHARGDAQQLTLLTRLGRLAEIGLTSGGLYAGSNSSKMSSHLRPRANSEATKRKSPDHASRTIV